MGNPDNDDHLIDGNGSNSDVEDDVFTEEFAIQFGAQPRS